MIDTSTGVPQLHILLAFKVGQTYSEPRLPVGPRCRAAHTSRAMSPRAGSGASPATSSRSTTESFRNLVVDPNGFIGRVVVDFALPARARPLFQALGTIDNFGH